MSWSWSAQTEQAAKEGKQKAWLHECRGSSRGCRAGGWASCRGRRGSPAWSTCPAGTRPLGRCAGAGLPAPASATAPAAHQAGLRPDTISPVLPDVSHSRSRGVQGWPCLLEHQHMQCEWRACSSAMPEPMVAYTIPSAICVLSAFYLRPDVAAPEKAKGDQRSSQAQLVQSGNCWRVIRVLTQEL